MGLVVGVLSGDTELADLLGLLREIARELASRGVGLQAVVS